MRYFIVALVVSLAWLHQDWFVWPFLEERNELQDYVPAYVSNLPEDERLAYEAAFAHHHEHELVMGLPLGVHYQVVISLATALVALLAVWKAWPTELERWAEAGSHRDRGGRNRGGRNRGERNRGGGRNRSRGEGGEGGGNSPRSGEGKSDSGKASAQSSGTDSSDRPRRRRRRGGRGRGGSGGGPNQGHAPSQPKAGE